MSDKDGLKQITNYAYYTKASRLNYQPEGFDFDVNMFENLIDCWTSEQDMLTILRCDIPTLDAFCEEVYHMNFRETYRLLSGITDAFMRKTFKNHANAGHAFSQSIVAKHFMGLRDDSTGNDNINITIVNDLQSDEPDSDGSGEV